MKKLIKVVMVLIVISFISGCAARRAILKEGELIVEKSAKARPQWITLNYKEEKDIMYFSGGVEKVSDYALGLREARVEAFKNLAESLQTKVRNEFTATKSGANIPGENLEKYVSDTVSTLVDNLHISGIKPAEVYYEKVKAGLENYYNCFVLIKISKSDYENAKIKALQKSVQKAEKSGDKEAEKAAKEVLQKLQ